MLHSLLSRINVLHIRGGRSMLILTLAAIAGLAAAWSARQHIQGHVERLEAGARVPMVVRVVAAHDLAAGTQLEAEHLASREFPAGLVSSDSIDPAHYSRLVGMVLQTNLRAGDVVLSAHGRRAAHGAFSRHLGEGRRAVTMPVDAISSVSGLLQPGDLIDLYVSFEYQRRRITAPLLQGVLVMATGMQTQFPANASAEHPSGYSTVTLDTSPEDAVKLVAARQSGSITAVLRHPNDDQPTRKAVRGDLASLLGVSQPPPIRAAQRAPVLYGNRSVRSVPRLVTPEARPRVPTGIFDLPHEQRLASAWLPAESMTDGPPLGEEAPGFDALADPAPTTDGAWGQLKPVSQP